MSNKLCKDIVASRKSGKVREIDELVPMMVITTTNGISAYDSKLPGNVPLKGLILQTISNKWMEQLGDVVPNHMIGSHNENYALLRALGYGKADAELLVRKCLMFPIEFIVRGYYIPTSKSWDSYKENCTIQGIQLPPGLQESQKLPEPIFTPTTKDKSDRPITYSEMVDIVKIFLITESTALGLSENEAEALAPNIAEELRELSLKLYRKAAEYAETRGIILADTKLEFGICLEDGKPTIILCDEAFTPDSSRYWDKDSYEVGKTQASMDKQFLRDYLRNELHWTGLKDGPVPDIPCEIYAKLSGIYNNILMRLFGIDFIESGKK